MHFVVVSAFLVIATLVPLTLLCLSILQVLDEAKDSVTCLQVSDHEILTGSADGRIRRYDIRQGKLYADMIGSKLKLEY